MTGNISSFRIKINFCFKFCHQKRLLKWCILTERHCRSCENIFYDYDVNSDGLLIDKFLEAAIHEACQLNNNKFIYLMSIMKICDYDIFSTGVNLKLFQLMTALGHRIKYLDDTWFFNILPTMDMSSIENKLFKVKNLWKIFVDDATNKISVKNILVEFSAGGVTDGHVEYARKKFSDRLNFDFLDFLTYLPLFIFMHDRIVSNPLERPDQRNI
jgi:hypothetical protein